MQRQAGRADLADPCYAEAIGIYRSNRETHSTSTSPTPSAAHGPKQRSHRRQNRSGRFELEARSLYEGANVNEGVAECDRRVAKLV